MAAKRHSLESVKLLIESYGWDDTCDKYASHIPRSDPTVSTDWLKKQVESGKLSHWQLVKDGVRIGAVFAAIRTGDNGKALVLDAIYSEDKGTHSPQVLPIIIQEAKALGCKSIEVNTARTAVANWLGAQGFQVQDVTLSYQI